MIKKFLTLFKSSPKVNAGDSEIVRALKEANQLKKFELDLKRKERTVTEVKFSHDLIIVQDNYIREKTSEVFKRAGMLREVEGSGFITIQWADDSSIVMLEKASIYSMSFDTLPREGAE